MTSCLLDSPCRGGALWHSLQPRGLWQSRCYHLNCRSRVAASGPPQAPMLWPTWHSWLSVWQILLSHSTCSKLLCGGCRLLGYYWLFLFLFFSSFLSEVVETQSDGRIEVGNGSWWWGEGNSFFCCSECTPQRPAGESWRGCVSGLRAGET